MPRKMAGSAMMTIEPSSVAMNMAAVVFASATHLYRSSLAVSPAGRLIRCPFIACPALKCTARS